MRLGQSASAPPAVHSPDPARARHNSGRRNPAVWVATCHRFWHAAARSPGSAHDRGGCNCAGPPELTRARPAQVNQPTPRGARAPSSGSEPAIAQLHTTAMASAHKSHTQQQIGGGNNRRCDGCAVEANLESALVSLRKAGEWIALGLLLAKDEILCSYMRRHAASYTFSRLIATSGQLTGDARRRGNEFRRGGPLRRRFSSGKAAPPALRGKDDHSGDLAMEH